MLSSKKEHADLAMQALDRYGDPNRVEWLQCNLENLNQVDRTARRLLSRLGRLDALVCNAGIGVGVYGETKDGIGKAGAASVGGYLRTVLTWMQKKDSHFQVNHLAHMHLTLKLLPLLQQTAATQHDARIIFQSSELHRLAPASTRFASLDEINTDIGPSYLYNRSKLAMTLFTRGLVQRLNDGRLGGGDVAKSIRECDASGSRLDRSAETG